MTEDATLLHLRQEGMDLLRARRPAEAATVLARLVALAPQDADAAFQYGMALHGSGDRGGALANYSRAIGLRSGFTLALFYRGGFYYDGRQMASALADFDAVVAQQPELAHGWLYRANTLHALDRPQEALESYARGEALTPDNAELHYAKGVVLQHLEREAEALAAFDRALALAPQMVEALNNRGAILLKQGQAQAALADFDRALGQRPDHVVAWCNRGAALRALRRRPEALQAYDRALALGGLDAEAWVQRAQVLSDAERLDEALADYDRALALAPGRADAQYGKATLLINMKRYAQGRALLEAITEPGNRAKHMLAGLAQAALNLCDWQAQEALTPRLREAAASGSAIVPPFIMLGYFSNPALLFAATQHYAAEQARRPAVSAAPAMGAHDRIRLAYLSADFQDHATTSLIASLIEAHDRAAFEVIGISFGADDGSAMRQRLRGAFDQFHDVAAAGDADIAALLRRLDVDIAIDLKGYTLGERPGIFALRPAPVQVNWLGFPGTMAVDTMDYILADRIVAPHEHQPYFSERIVHLPDSYQVNDPTRPRPVPPTRAAAGLPADGMVFASFNNHWKISRAFFEIWMRLLQQVPGSVLWLLEDTASATLQGEAAARGVDPARLIFAPRVGPQEHLARTALADLVLDTLPCGAHTTASDALWMGVPVLTCLGGSFAGRVAASLLHAVGLPELVAPDPAAYEALALRLAQAPRERQQLRDRLATPARLPLFDLPRFRAGLEAAFKTMHARRNAAPESFDVPPQA